MQNTHNQLCRAALIVLIVLQLVMLAALFTKTPPHPLIAVAPFALGPFLGGSLAIALASFFLGAATTRGGRAPALLAGVLALISFGLRTGTIPPSRRSGRPFCWARLRFFFWRQASSKPFVIDGWLYLNKDPRR